LGKGPADRWLNEEWRAWWLKEGLGEYGPVDEEAESVRRPASSEPSEAAEKERSNDGATRARRLTPSLIALKWSHSASAGSKRGGRCDSSDATCCRFVRRGHQKEKNGHTNTK
jgi:hypothetical protein